MGGRNPWRDLRQRPDIELSFEVLGKLAGHCAAEGEYCSIVINRRLLRRARAETLGHEMSHLNRGLGFDHPDPVVRLREERWTEDANVANLIPLEELIAWALHREANDLTVEARDIAEHFDRTEEFACKAWRLAEHPSAAHLWKKARDASVVDRATSPCGDPPDDLAA